MIQESSAYRDFYASIIDSVGDGVVVLDCKGFPSLINPAAEEMLGISRRQAESTHCSVLFRQEDILLEMIEKTAATGMTVSDHENIVLKRLGHLTPVSVTTSPLVLNNGETIGTILVLRDLTNVRELEDAVRHADRLSTIGTLAAGLAHEIKNPLGGIKGAAQLLEQDLPHDSELREYTGVMIREVQRVNRIVEELLDLATPRKLQLSPVNLHQVLGDILVLQQRATGKRKISFHQHFDPSIPAILADEALLTQLFLNLVKNAVEAAPDNGNVSVNSRVWTDYSMTHKGERRSRMVAVEVCDDGPGIARENMDMLFTPFFTTKSKGTGLGLSLCQKIVSEHRGQIKIESDPGQGTMFSVMLPLIQ